MIILELQLSLGGVRLIAAHVDCFQWFPAHSGLRLRGIKGVGRIALKAGLSAGHDLAIPINIFRTPALIQIVTLFALFARSRRESVFVQETVFDWNHIDAESVDFEIEVAINTLETCVVHIAGLSIVVFTVGNMDVRPAHVVFEVITVLAFFAVRDVLVLNTVIDSSHLAFLVLQVVSVRTHNAPQLAVVDEVIFKTVRNSNETTRAG